MSDTTDWVEIVKGRDARIAELEQQCDQLQAEVECRTIERDGAHNIANAWQVRCRKAEQELDQLKLAVKQVGVQP